MQKEELSSPNNLYQPYEYEVINLHEYYFQTKAKAEYEVLFKPSAYVFGDDYIHSEHVYELVILAKYLPQTKGPSDTGIAATNALIVEHFYNGNDNLVCIYICDASDGRQHARERKFQQWMDFFGGKKYLTVTDSIIDANGIDYPVSIIIKFNNPFRNQLLDAFEKIVISNSKV